jgi:hypothetical protein
MRVEELTIGYKDLLIALDGSRVNKVVNYWYNQSGFCTSSDLADKLGVSKQVMSARIKAHPEKYEVSRFRKKLYVKEKEL